jgi:PAS domain S-box-containing protein
VACRRGTAWERDASGKAATPITHVVIVCQETRGAKAHAADGCPTARRCHSPNRRTSAPTAHVGPKLATEREVWHSLGALQKGGALTGAKDIAVSSRFKTREEAAWNQALLERFLDGAPLGIIVLDTDLRFLRVNSRATTMLGIAEDALRGDRFKDALPAMFNELEAILTDVVVGGTARLGVETSAPTFRSRDQPRRYLGSYYPLKEPDGTVIGVGCMFTDITEQRAAEHALADSEAQRDAILGEMLRAEEAERSRLALGLHDDTIQVLCALLVLLDQTIPLALRHNETEIGSRLKAARDVLAGATDRARHLMFELHPSVLHQRGLNAAVTALADDIVPADQRNVDDRHPRHTLFLGARRAHLPRRERSARQRSQALPGRMLQRPSAPNTRGSWQASSETTGADFPADPQGLPCPIRFTSACTR